MVYAAHVLHHVDEHGALLAEVYRCLRPQGILLLIETVENHPLVRVGRTLHPWWHGDAVQARFKFSSLLAAVQNARFDVLEAAQYSVFFWLWELLPERFAWLDKATPLFVALELLLARILQRWGAHCYCVARPLTKM